MFFIILSPFHREEIMFLKEISLLFLLMLLYSLMLLPKDLSYYFLTLLFILFLLKKTISITSGNFDSHFFVFPRDQ